MAKLGMLSIASPGSRPLKNTRHERYCRLRASAQPRISAYREAGGETSDDDDAYSNACRLERRPEIQNRIAFLTRQAEDVIAEKRQRIEERLWSIHESNIQDFFTTEITPITDKNGNPQTDGKVGVSCQARDVPRPLADLDPETAKLIEDVTVDSRGRLIPKLYSKAPGQQRTKSHAQPRRKIRRARCHQTQ